MTAGTMSFSMTDQCTRGHFVAQQCEQLLIT